MSREVSKYGNLMKCYVGNVFKSFFPVSYNIVVRQGRDRVFGPHLLHLY